VLAEEGIEWDRAVQIAARIDTAQKEALEAFGPELVLSAAETLWIPSDSGVHLD
jgi:hypothetical protein